ncbi:formate dehydrogenase accessory sulfurtransferase FdhD [Acidianus manzaensis]|uniref:Sulfur carrier protein FdhD n=1 Tax=Acidianus manzaensis TaxID=282676 RepID=A0A1W6JYC6_9CREN|nr:formate dehydrogenase accessory sulfurtransferase FdhD [Acidianus manzaensis]ARM75268.1 formate dehydrogenase family accessory protein FdhD [Acidianus manzaensis]
MSQKIKSIKYEDNEAISSEEDVVIESPLKLTIQGEFNTNTIYIMRTPGDDEELALGFLFTQGIISGIEDIVSLEVNENEVHVKIAKPVKFEREILVNSSCGICGNPTMLKILENKNTNFKINASLILSLPEKMIKKQKLFQETGGLHAAALFDREGNLIDIKEDVGRHNAVDKLIGKMISKKLDGSLYILQVSGRAGYEIVEKAIIGKIPIISAISAPTTSSIELCKITGTTLIGFIRQNKFNIYAHPERIIFD